MKFLGSSCKVKNYCLDITSSLMRSKSLLQSIQCSGSSFLLNIIWLSSVLCFQDACLYQQNLLERCPEWQTTISDLGFAQPRMHSSSDHLLGLLWPNFTSLLTNMDSYDNVLPVFRLFNIIGLSPRPNIYLNTYYWAYHPNNYYHHHHHHHHHHHYHYYYRNCNP